MPKDKVTGHLLVGTNGEGEVIINHPDIQVDADGAGHIVFSPRQARGLARLLLKCARLAQEEIAAAFGDQRGGGGKA